VQKDGYELWVLEQTVHKSVNEINKELLAFIQNDCYAGAYLRQGWRSRNETQKREAFLKALQLKPNYRKAKLELALCSYRSGDYKQCRSWLVDILRFPESSEYRDATEYMGHSYYKEGNYTEALEYYQKSLEYSDYYEYKYNLYYGIACCHHNMKDYTKAEKFYKMYLDSNWESEKSPKEVAYAKEYHKLDANEGSEEKLNMKQNGKD
jgi:tetratricopeptide (TPR) repeat protein